ncbi:MAG: hypothetical protein JST75_03790 [Bacteroidetes bacterium]|nr:hypothetical protein [Bacteroidota bacterium]
MGNRVSLIHQEGALRSYFPGSEITRRGEDELLWVGEISPTPLSGKYKIKLHYKRREFISVFVLSPKLRLAEGATKLPHVYSTLRQELCLYYPKNNEWNQGMFYVKSLIPWASEWLYHYEIWAGCGKWYGGGIDHEGENEEKERSRNEIKV